MKDKYAITEETVEQLSHQARVALTPREKEKYARDLGAMLEMVSVLDSLPPANDHSSAQVRLSALREDIVCHRPHPATDYRVPGVMEDT